MAKCIISYQSNLEKYVVSAKKAVRNASTTRQNKNPPPNLFLPSDTQTLT